MHGGALGSGAPRDNQNALKHGTYTREAIAERRRISELVRQSRKLLLKVE
jgi:glucans biosynthesis protein